MKIAIFVKLFNFLLSSIEYLYYMMDLFMFSSVKWEGGAGADPRYHQVDGQLTITNVDRNRDKGGWTCSVVTPGGELAKREVISKPIYILASYSRVYCYSAIGSKKIKFSACTNETVVAISPRSPLYCIEPSRQCKCVSWVLYLCKK